LIHALFAYETAKKTQSIITFSLTYKKKKQMISVPVELLLEKLEDPQVTDGYY